MPWDPDRYRQFAARAAPFDDLMALVAVRPSLRVIDLGCGSGDLTARLADRLSDDLRAPFIDRFRARVVARWPDGPVLMPSKRIVLAATKPRES